MAESTLSVFSQCPTNLFLFQSTHPSGVRLWQAPACPSEADFDPRTPSGVRPSCDNGSMNLIEICPNGREARNMRRAIAVGQLCHQPYERLGHVTTELVPVESVTMHLTARELMFEND